MTGDVLMSAASVIEAEGAAVASAVTCDIWATDGNTRHVTGSTGPIISFGTAPQVGARMCVIFDGTPTLTQSADLNLNSGGSNIVIEAGDVAFVYADTTTQFDVFVERKSGAALVAGNVSLASTTEILTGIDAAKMVTPDALAALWEQGSNIASAATISIGEGGYFNVTGTTGISDIDFGTDKAGRFCVLRFAGACVLTHSATLFLNNGGSNITTAAGDILLAWSEGSDTVRGMLLGANGTMPNAPTKSGGGASGTWALNVTGSAGTLSGSQADWASLRSSAVANMLGWKNYGNAHVIFDASNATSPTSSAVGSTDSAVAWSAGYPTLMGWNGISTYGVRVDSARVADSCSGNAATASNGGVTSIAAAGSVGDSLVTTGTGAATIKRVRGSANISVTAHDADSIKITYLPGGGGGNDSLHPHSAIEMADGLQRFALIRKIAPRFKQLLDLRPGDKVRSEFGVDTVIGMRVGNLGDKDFVSINGGCVTTPGHLLPLESGRWGAVDPACYVECSYNQFKTVKTVRGLLTVLSVICPPADLIKLEPGMRILTASGYETIETIERGEHFSPNQQTIAVLLERGKLLFCDGYAVATLA